MSADTLYKIVGADGAPVHGGSGQWSLPTLNDDGSWTPGEWREVAGRLVYCRNALHLTDGRYLYRWAESVVYEADASWLASGESCERRPKPCAAPASTTPPSTTARPSRRQRNPPRVRTRDGLARLPVPRRRERRTQRPSRFSVGPGTVLPAPGARLMRRGPRGKPAPAPLPDPLTG